MPARLLACIFLAGTAPCAVRLLVSVVDPATGQTVTGLAATDFQVTEGRFVRTIESVEALAAPLRILFLVDASAAGAAVRPAAESFISELAENEQMTLVSFDNSATVVQEFTPNKELLRSRLAAIPSGGNPRLLDAVLAAVDHGFPAPGTPRKVVILLTAGIEGPNRSAEVDVVRAARNKGISIYPVYVHGSSRYLFESISRKTGGAPFSLRDHSAARTFQAIRAPYVLVLAGDQSPGESASIKVKGQDTVFVSALPLQ